MFLKSWNAGILIKIVSAGEAWADMEVEAQPAEWSLGGPPAGELHVGASSPRAAVAERVAEIRKGLLEADQALEDTVSILSGYIGFLREKEVGPPPEYQDPTVQAPVVSPNKEGVESE